MSKKKKEETSRFQPLRWAVGVPLGSNPLIILDFLSILVIVWLISWMALLIAQFYFDGFVHLQHLKGAAVLASDLSALLTIFYLGVCFLMLRNRYAAVYRFDENGIFCDNLKTFPRALKWKPLHFRCYPIKDPDESGKKVSKHISWHEIVKAPKLAELRVIFLKGKRGTLLRIYCPTEEIMNEAAERIHERILHENGSSEKE